MSKRKKHQKKQMGLAMLHSSGILISFEGSEMELLGRCAHWLEILTSHITSQLGLPLPAELPDDLKFVNRLCKAVAKQKPVTFTSSGLLAMLVISKCMKLILELPQLTDAPRQILENNGLKLPEVAALEEKLSLMVDATEGKPVGLQA